jgi:hypothetical protein
MKLEIICLKRLEFFAKHNIAPMDEKYCKPNSMPICKDCMKYQNKMYGYKPRDLK